MEWQVETTALGVEGKRGKSKGLRWMEADVVVGLSCGKALLLFGEKEDSEWEWSPMAVDGFNSIERKNGKNEREILKGQK